MSSPQENDSKSDADKPEKPVRVQLKHVLLDHDFFDKPKIKALKYDWKSEGVLLFIAILCDMSRATDSEISDSCIKATAETYGFHRERAEEFIAYLLDHNLIHRCTNPLYVANRRVLKDQEAMATKQDKWKKAKRNQREQQEKPKGQTEDKSETSLGRMNIELLNSELLNIEDLKKGGIALVGEFDHPEIWRWLTAWANKLKRDHGRRLDQIQVEALCSTYKSRENLRAALRHTCSLSFAKNVIPPPERDRNPRPQPAAQSPPGAPNGAVKALVGSVLKSLPK